MQNRILKFTAGWCVACDYVNKVFEKHKIECTSYDIDDENTTPIADKYDVLSLPTIIITDASGNKLDHILAGELTEEEIIKKLQKSDIQCS